MIPGPGQYNVQSTSMAPKISVATRNHRYADNHDNHMPGPGNYNVTYDGIVRNQTSYTMGVRCSSKEQEA